MEQLSRIPPFNQSNLRNQCSSLVEHIEQNSEQWKTYINGNQFLEQRMELFAKREGDRKKKSRKQRGQQLSSESNSDEEDLTSFVNSSSPDVSRTHSVLSEQKKLMKKVNERKMLNLGVPGGYEQYNYKEAFKPGEHVYHKRKSLAG